MGNEVSGNEKSPTPEGMRLGHLDGDSEAEVSGPGWPPQFRVQREVRKC